MAKQQAKSQQRKGGNMEAMLIQGESGLNETMDNNTMFMANPMQQAINNILTKDANNANKLQKNLEKPFEEVDKVTGELVRSISDTNVRNVVMGVTRDLKNQLYQTSGQGMDIVNGELGDLERAVTEWQSDQKAFSQNLNGEGNSKGGPSRPHYSAGTGLTTLTNNARVYGGDYKKVVYNPQTKELEWLLEDNNIVFDHLETEEDRRKGRNLQSFVDRGRELTPEQQAEYDRLLPKSKPASRVVTQTMLDEDVVLFDANVQTAIQTNVTTLKELGKKGEKVTRDDQGNVVINGFDLHEMTNDNKTLITMAWDNHLHTSGGKTFVEHWRENNPKDDMAWATQGKGFDHKKLKTEVTNYYQQKMNKQYEDGVENYKDNTVAGRNSEAIDFMVNDAFSQNVDAISGEGGNNNKIIGSPVGPDKKFMFDYSAVIGDSGNKRIGIDADGNFEIQVYDKTINDYVTKDVISSDTDVERFKRHIKVHFGSSTAY